MKDYFNLQVVRVKRRIIAIGVHPLFGLLIGVVVFYFISSYLFNRTEFASYLAIAAGLGLLFPLTDKNRTDFIRITFGDTEARKIRV